MIPLNGTAVEEKLSRYTTADIFRAIPKERDPAPIIDLMLDQSMPRDLRRTAGERLNELEEETLEFIRLETRKDYLQKIIRSGLVQQKFAAFAKGRLAALEGKAPAKCDNPLGDCIHDKDKPHVCERPQDKERQTYVQRRILELTIEQHQLLLALSKRG